MKKQRPYFRISIKGYYPEGSKSKLKAIFYTKSESFIGKLVQFIAQIKN